MKATNPVTLEDRYVFYVFPDADTVGTPIEDVENPIVYVGHRQPTAYPTEQNYENVPDGVLEHARADGYTPVTGVGVDLSEATPL